MRRLVALLPLSVLLVPAAANGASVQTDRTCYLQTDRTNVTVSGNGFPAGRPYSVSLDGTALTGGLGTMDAGGAMQGAFAPPALTRARRSSARLTALRRPGLLRNNGRAELNASIRKVRPGLRKSCERLIPYFSTRPRAGSK